MKPSAHLITNLTKEIMDDLDSRKAIRIELRNSDPAENVYLQMTTLHYHRAAPISIHLMHKPPLIFHPISNRKPAPCLPF